MEVNKSDVPLLCLCQVNLLKVETQSVLSLKVPEFVLPFIIISEWELVFLCHTFWMNICVGDTVLHLTYCMPR